MALTPPSQAIYPMSRIQSVDVLYDGTLPNNLEFSIARLTLKDGSQAIGIRHDRNEWNENNEENGYPVVRGGRPSWFLLPDINNLSAVLNMIVSKNP
jgi:hypothetical protein